MQTWMYYGIFAALFLACLVWLVREFGPERIWTSIMAMLAGVGVIHIMTLVNLLPHVVP
jgi:hypothetical protein